MGSRFGNGSHPCHAPYHSLLVEFPIINAYRNFPVPVPPVSLTSDIPTPVPLLSSPTLTCTVDLSDFNINAVVSLGLTGPGSFDTSATQFLFGSVPSLQISASLGSIDFGSGEGEYTCSSTITPAELGQPFIPNIPAIGSETIDIEIDGRSA